MQRGSILSVEQALSGLYGMLSNVGRLSSQSFRPKHGNSLNVPRRGRRHFGVLDVDGRRPAPLTLDTA